MERVNKGINHIIAILWKPYCSLSYLHVLFYFLQVSYLFLSIISTFENCGKSFSSFDAIIMYCPILPKSEGRPL